MAISAPTKSSQYTDYSASPKKMVASGEWGSKLRSSYAKLTFTAAGFTTAGAGDLSLLRMPAGKVRILPDLSRVICPVGTATADLDVGYGAYTKPDGTAVVLDGDAFVASADVGGGAIDAAFDAATVVGLEFESRDGFDIVASVDTANSPAAGDLIVVVVYQMGN